RHNRDLADRSLRSINIGRRRRRDILAPQSGLDGRSPGPGGREAVALHPWPGRQSAARGGPGAGHDHLRMADWLGFSWRRGRDCPVSPKNADKSKGLGAAIDALCTTLVRQKREGRASASAANRVPHSIGLLTTVPKSPIDAPNVVG